MQNPAQWSTLIIDDEPHNIGVAAYILDFHDVRTRTATNGPDGLAMLREEKPTFLLLDIQMPVMTGWDVLKRIREDEQLKDVCVIAFSAHLIGEQKDKALEAGFDGYLGKPVSPASFIDDIKSIVQKRLTH
jgi:CheY-like chemotaxis protein